MKMKKTEKIEQLERLKKAETLLQVAEMAMPNDLLKGMVHTALVQVSNALYLQRNEILK